MKNNIFQSKLKTVQELLEQSAATKFIIPVYQRPYVWGDLEINKLLEDIHASFLIDRCNPYFIGNIYVSQVSDNTYIVIDGQQRFITLWLTAFAFRYLKQETIFTSFLGEPNNLRLGFAIRKEIENYLKALLRGSIVEENETSKSEFLRYIAAGIEIINGKLQNFQSESTAFRLSELGNYIFKNVTFVFNIAPERTDLNSLFTALGNSGIQLEQTDILKAQLLKGIENKVRYSKIWEACENMDDYFENNVLSIFSKPQKNNLTIDEFQEYNEKFLFEYAVHENIKNKKQGLPISEITKIETLYKENEEGNNSMKKNRCHSIIPFSVLLIHAYRIFRHQRSDQEEDIPQGFDKKNLLSIFATLVNSGDLIISQFFFLLWKIRFLFDKHVVKWRFDNESDENSDEEEKLRLTSVNKNEDSFTRQNLANSKMSMLQSVLYFTGGYNQQYWLTPFLAFLLNNEKGSKEDMLTILERIDNLMLPGEKKKISWELINEEKRNEKRKNIKENIGANLGTGFNHYWFYKLEYLLWKEWSKKDDPKFGKFRITSKNSVEHVFSQNDEFGEELIDDNGLNWLHSFGNLGLLSVSQNSEYSNQNVDKKKIDFQKKTKYDSLKLAKIYLSDSKEPIIKQIQKHQTEMLLLFNKHYQ